MDERLMLHLKRNGYLQRSNGKMDHIAVVEEALGRELKHPEEVHHVDFDRANNENTNLVLCPDRSYHRLLHRRSKALNACGHADWLQCKYCKTWGPPDSMFSRKYANCIQTYHQECNRLRSKRIRGKNGPCGI